MKVLSPDKLTKATLTVTIEIPEILVETMKIIAALNCKTFEQYMKQELMRSIAANIDCHLGHTGCCKDLYKLAQNLENI